MAPLSANSTRAAPMGCSGGPWSPSDRIVGFEALEFGSAHSSGWNAGHSLDACGLHKQGIKIMDESGAPFFVPDDENVACFGSPCFGFQVASKCANFLDSLCDLLIFTTPGEHDAAPSYAGYNRVGTGAHLRLRWPCRKR